MAPRLGSVLVRIAAALLLAGACTRPAAAADPDFDSHWRDGKAELSGYRLVVSRYGAPRAGQAVMITVTEPFSASRHVKLDDWAKHRDDLLDVLKLNLVRDFQTGIYDYNTEVSLFVRTRDFAPVKLTFSSAEWCGHVYEQADFRNGRIEQQVFSYFDGESGRRSLAIPAGGFVEDALFVALRGLRGPMLQPGASRTVPLLPSPFVRRLNHTPAVWGEARIARRARSERVSVPAGAFEVDAYDVACSDGRIGLFQIERAYPHRIVRWQWRKGGAQAASFAGAETGELEGTRRLDYWRLNAPGDEKLLEGLGIEPTVRATAPR